MKNSTSTNVFTNVYGLARSLVALSNLTTLLFTNSNFQFDKGILTSYSQSQFIPNFFALFGYDNLNLSISLASIILLWVISGYLPQITGFLHVWIIYSFFSSATFVEGGDQISQIITILLLPICIFDKRINHWSKTNFFTYNRPEFINYFCYSCIVIIQLQASFLYFFAVAEKIHVEEWKTGTAFYYWYNGNMFGTNSVLQSFFNPFINSPIISPIITWCVLIFEFILAGAIFMSGPNKRKVIIPAILFHFFIIIFHGLSTFFLAMSGLLIIYLLNHSQYINFSFIKSFKLSNKVNYAVYLFVFTILFSSCNKEKSKIVPVSNYSATDSVYEIAKGLYYWKDRLPSNEDFFKSNEKNMTIEAILHNLRKYSPKLEGSQQNIDKWSFATTLDEWHEMISGQMGDFGLGLRFRSDNDLRISWVQPKSEPAELNLNRGIKVLKLNEVSASRNNIDKLTEIMDKSNSLVLTVQDELTKEAINITVKRRHYNFDPVISAKIINHNNKAIGYLNIISFTNNLNESLQELEKEGFFNSISELILDLRYNSGGLMLEMENLANLIAPVSAKNEIMYETIHNPDLSHLNFKTIFRPLNINHDIQKIHFIISETTASASEILIHSLSTHLPCSIIGRPSGGKLMGMYTVNFGNYIIAPLSFNISNSKKQIPIPGTGITPDIIAYDDLLNDFDKGELCIAYALDSPKDYQKSKMNSNLSIEINSGKLPPYGIEEWKKNRK